MHRLSLCAAVACASIVAPMALAHDFDGPLGRIASYQFGQSREPLTQVEDMVVHALKNPGERAKLAEDLAQLLASGHASPDAELFICRQLAVIGGPAQVPVLARLLGNPRTAEQARLALHAIPGNESDRALVSALKSTAGETRAGIITSLGVRQYERAAGPIAKYISDPDEKVAGAAIAALGKIGTPKAARLLAQAGRKAPAELQLAITQARLEAAGLLDEQGKRFAADQIYEELRSPSQPGAIRTAAYIGGEHGVRNPEAYRVPDDVAERKAAKRKFHRISEHAEAVADRQ